MHPYRTRFKKDIIAEFYPPLGRKPKQDRVIIFCSGLPGELSKGRVLESWAKKGFWTFAFRYRGTWESGGRLLRKSPERDVLDIIDALPRGFTEYFENRRFRVARDARVFLFGNSFGGPAALLASRDPRVVKAVCFSPVVDWKYQAKHGETNEWTRKFTRNAFGEAYRFTDRDWRKLGRGDFYDPMSHMEHIDGSKILILHAKDDKIVLAGPIKKFTNRTGATLWLLAKGGHTPSTWHFRPRFQKRIAKFLKQK